MTQEIESVKPALTVILDDGDFIINSTGPIGKLMAQAILPVAASANRVTVITDGEMKVMKRNGNGAVAQAPVIQPPTKAAQQHVAATEIAKQYADGPDIQEQFAADLEAGITGEIATGEAPPTKSLPSPKRKPVIFQDQAAPPAPELAEEEMSRLLTEAAQAEADATRAAEDQRFQRQQAVQAQVEPSDIPADQPAESSAARPRKREPRNLATTGRPCGRCGGGGKVVGDAGFEGACPVCHGEGQVKSWDRGLKVR